MPLLLAALVTLGVEETLGWRLALLVPGVLMLIMALLYHRYAPDTADGTPAAPGTTGESAACNGTLARFLGAAGNYRVWVLFLAYAASFGIELTMHNFAALYFVDGFGLDVGTAGLYAGSFGLLALFARTLGGYASDRRAARAGIDGRASLITVLLLFEGIGLLLFSQMSSAGAAFGAMLATGLFTHMVCGATYGLVPFIDRSAPGCVAGIVGAGGNVGAVAAGFLMKSSATTAEGLAILGGCVLAGAGATLALRFSREHEAFGRVLPAEAAAPRGQAVSTASGASGVD